MISGSQPALPYTEGLEPHVTERIIELTEGAPGGKVALNESAKPP